MNKAISTPDAPKAVGPYSQAILAGKTLYISGQLPVDPGTGEIPEEIEDQAHQSLLNVGAILSEAGYSFSDVVKTTVLLKDINDFAAVNAVYAEYFSDPMPARACFQVAALPKGAAVEIEAIAVK